MSQRSTPHEPRFLHRSRAESLEKDFLDCLDKIEKHQEILLPPGFMSDYKALGWIETKDGLPQITNRGMHMVRTLKTRACQDKS